MTRPALWWPRMADFLAERIGRADATLWLAGELILFRVEWTPGFYLGDPSGEKERAESPWTYGVAQLLPETIGLDGASRARARIRWLGADYLDELPGNGGCYPISRHDAGKWQVGTVIPITHFPQDTRLWR